MINRYLTEQAMRRSMCYRTHRCSIRTIKLINRTRTRGLFIGTKAKIAHSKHVDYKTIHDLIESKNLLLIIQQISFSCY